MLRKFEIFVSKLETWPHREGIKSLLTGLMRDYHMPSPAALCFGAGGSLPSTGGGASSAWSSSLMTGASITMGSAFGRCGGLDHGADDLGLRRGDLDGDVGFELGDFLDGGSFLPCPARGDLGDLHVAVGIDARDLDSGIGATLRRDLAFVTGSAVWAVAH